MYLQMFFDPLMTYINEDNLNLFHLWYITKIADWNLILTQKLVGLESVKTNCKCIDNLFEWKFCNLSV